ncbi:MAG: HEAT repeat domain-containing protein, partial [Armatimonadota bacterium]
AIAIVAVVVSWQSAAVKREAEIAVLIADIDKVGSAGGPQVDPRAFARYGEAAVPALVGVLDSPDSSHLAKRQALDALGCLKDPGTLSILQRWAEQDDPELAQSAFSAIGALGTEEAIAYLLRSLRDRTTRRPAIVALGEGRAAEAREPLLDVVRSVTAAGDQGEADTQAACAAAEALGRIGGGDVREALLPLLARGGTRWSAAAGLAWLGEPDGFRVLLEEYLGSEDRSEQARTAQVLLDIGQQAHPYLVQGLDRKYPTRTRAMAVAVIAEGRAVTAVEPLGRIVADDAEPGHLREQAALALGEIGTREALRALLRAAPKAPDALRRSIEFGLVKIRDPDADRIFLDTLKSGDPAQREAAARVLGIRGVPDAVPPLIEALRDEEPGVRLQAVQALGTIGDPTAIASVERLLEDSDPDVRKKARATLSRLRAASGQ